MFLPDLCLSTASVYYECTGAELSCVYRSRIQQTHQSLCYSSGKMFSVLYKLVPNILDVYHRMRHKSWCFFIESFM